MDIIATFTDYSIFYLQMLFQQAIVLNIAKIPYKAGQLIVTVLIIFLLNISVLLFSGQFEYLFQVIWVLLLFAAYRLSYKQPIKKSAVMAICQMVCNSGVEAIMLFFISTVLPLAWIEYLMNNINIVKIFLILLYIIGYIITKKTCVKPDYNSNEVTGSWIIYLLFIFAITDPIILRIEAADKYLENLEELSLFFLLIVFLGYNVFYVARIQKASNIEQQLEIQHLYAESLEKTVDGLKGFKHDYANIINTISGYVHIEDWNALKSYILQLNTDFLKIKATEIVNSGLASSPVLYGIVLSKISRAELTGTSLDIAISCEINLRYCSDVDFSRIIGVLLDNAIEEACKSEKKEVNIRISEELGRLVVEISNSCDTVLENIQQFYKRGYSSKAEHQGEGLYQISLIIGKYQRRGFCPEIITEYENGVFYQRVTL